MFRKVLIGVLVLALALSAGLFFWARAVFTQDSVRAALARQLSDALGQPVTVGGIAASIYPRVTVQLQQVGIGEPARITVKTLHLGTDFRALLSRRIEHGRLELAGARVVLPLPAFSIRSGSTSGPSPVEIVSIDDIVLRGVEIVSGGRTLTGDVELVPRGYGVTIRRVKLGAGRATVDVTGEFSDVSGPVGALAIKSGSLDLDRLLAFANDFSAGSGVGEDARGSHPQPPRAGAASGGAPMDVALSLECDRATLGELSLDKLEGRARISAGTMKFDPVTFGVFGGRAEGSLAVAMGAVPEYAFRASLSGVDMAAVGALVGSPGTITGRLSGTVNLVARGATASTAMKASHGTVRVDVVNGIVRNLGLVRTAVVALSGRPGGEVPAGGSRDEPFARLGATMVVAGGSATTDDLRFESKDVLGLAGGSIRLDGSDIDLRGRLQLSDELTAQAGRDLVRYTQEGGRVTVPATVTGSAADPHVRIDAAGLLGRALSNRANEELRKALKKGLGGLIKR